MLLPLTALRSRRNNSLQAGLQHVSKLNKGLEMQAEYNNHESPETPSRRTWETPEVQVLMVDETENSTVFSTDGTFFAS